MELKRLRAGTGDVWQMMVALYEAAFPYHERRDAEAQLRAMADEAYHFHVIYDDEETAIGFITYWESDAFLYLEHFATLPQVRGRGYGAEALELIKKSGKLLILEAELPTDELTSRRIGFYERCGFAVNPHRHLQPPYHGEHALAQMKILTYPRTVSVDEYHDMYRYIWRVVTGEELSENKI